MRELRPTLEESIPVRRGYDLISIEPVFDGSALALWKRHEQSSTDGDYAVSSVLGGNNSSVDVSVPDVSLFRVQSDGDGRLAALGYTVDTTDDYRSNFAGRSILDLETGSVFIYDHDGRPLQIVDVGAYANHFQMTESGRAWLGYEDRGVFSDHALAENGLVSLALDGQPDFKFNPAMSPQSLKPIIECYSINTFKDAETWVYYYTADDQFPLVKLFDLQLERSWIPGDWMPRVKGSTAFAISSDHGLFRGGYDDEDSWWLLNLKGYSSEEIKLDLPDEQVRETIRARGHGEFEYVRPKLHATGRGPYLYLWTKTWIGRYDMRDLL